MISGGVVPAFIELQTFVLVNDITQGDLNLWSVCSTNTTDF